MTEASVFEPAGRAITYSDEGAGPAVVLVPAAGFDIDYLGTLAHVLVEEDFRVLRVGSRGFGSDDVTLHDLAQDVVDVMSSVGIDRAWVGGHAFGGTVARVASLDHPDRLNGVLLMGVEASDATASAPETPIPVRDETLAAAQLAAREATPVADWTTVAAMFPVLVIQGTDDDITPPANGDALQAAAADRVSVVRIEGAGHFFPRTHVGDTSWAIEDYLDWD